MPTLRLLHLFRRGLLMLLWFVGTSIAAVWFVFRDPQFNFRLVVVGALIPDIIDGIGGGAGPLHSVVTVIALLAVVMLITTGRRPVRKPLLAVIIGLFMHLVFDGAFANTSMFWWPLGGFATYEQALPSIDRGWINVGLELVGVGLILWVRSQIGQTGKKTQQTQ
jgi:hypothetical protein